MAGKAQKIDAPLVHVNREPGSGLRRVGVNERSHGVTARGDLGERLQHPNLVVRGHDRHDERPLIEYAIEIGEIDEAIRSDPTGRTTVS